MTWEQFKKAMTDAGVEDRDEIHGINVGWTDKIIVERKEADEFPHAASVEVSSP